MGNDASKIKTLQILKVNENSVSHKNNLLPFMHTIIKYNDKPIKTNLDALEINKEWENDDLVLEIRDLRTDTDFSLIIPKKNGEKLGMNIKYHDDIIKLFTVKILDIVPGSPAEKCGLVKSDYILGVENVSCENENELLKYIECRKKAGMPLLVFNPEMNFIRKVEFKVPSGLGFFGCEIGLGILYRIPADGRNISMEFDKDKINEELDKLRKKQEEEENYSESELTNKDQEVMSETYKEKMNLSNVSKKETVKDEEVLVDDVNEGVTKDNDENKDSKIKTSLYDKEIKKQPEERLNEDQIQNGSKLLDDEGERINSKESRIHESFKSKIREENDIKSLQNDLEKDGKEEVLKKPEDQENEEDNSMHKNNGKVGSKIKNSVSDFKTKVLEENHKENGSNREHTNEDKDLSGVDERSISRGKENKEEFFDKSPNEMIKPELSSQGTKLQNFDKNEPIIEKENKIEKVSSYQEKENKSSAHDVETEKTPDINDSKEKEENLSKNKVAINNLSSRKLEDDVVKGNESKSEDQNVLKSTQKTSILDQEDMDKDKKSLDVADKKTQIKEHLSKLGQKKVNDDLSKRENESEKSKNEDMKKTEEKINNNSFDKKSDLDKIETTKKTDKSLSGMDKIDETGRKEEAKSHQDKHDNPEDIANNKSEEKLIPEQDRSEKVKDPIENKSLNSLISEVDRSGKSKHDTADNKDDLSDIKDMSAKLKNNTEERKGDKASTSKNKSDGLGKTPEREDKDRSSLENLGSLVESKEEKEEIKSKDKSCKTKENKVEDELSSFNSEDMQKKKMNSEILKSKDKSYKAIESEDKNQSNKPGDLSSGETSNDVLTSKDKSDKISKIDKNSDEISLEKNPFSNQQDVTKKVDDRSISSVENKSDRIKDLYAKKETFLDEKNPDKLSDAFQNDKISDRFKAHEKVKEISQNNLNKAKNGSNNETVEHLSDGKNNDILSNKDESLFQNISNKSIEANGIVREGSKILEENTKLTNKIDGFSDDMDRTDGLKIDLKSEQIKNSTGNGSERETTPVENELKNHESTLKNDSKLSTQDILKGKEKFDASSIKKNEEIGISEEGENINQSDPIQKTKSLTDPSKAFSKEKKILDDIDKNESNKPNEHTEKMENDKNELKDQVKINESSEFAKDTLSNQKIETDKLNNKDDQKSEIFKNNLISNSGKNYQSKLQDSLQKQETIRITNQDIAEESKKQELSEKKKSDDSLKIKDDELFEEKQNEKDSILKNIQSFSSYRESVIEKEGNLDSLESQVKNIRIPDQRISNTKDPENSMSTEITKNEITESLDKNFKNDTISANKDVGDTKHFNRMSDGEDLSYKNKNKTDFSELQTNEPREIGKKSEFIDVSLSKDKFSIFKSINKDEPPDSILLEDTSKKSSIKDTKNKIPEDLSLVNKTVSSLIEKFEKSSHKLDKQPSNIPDHSSFDTITLNRQLDDILESSRDESITLTPYKIQLSDESSIENYYNDSDESKDEKKITSKIDEDNTGKKNHQMSENTELLEKIRENVSNAREEFKKGPSGESKKVDGSVSDSKLKKDEKSEISGSSEPDYFENKKDNFENKARVNSFGMEETKLVEDIISKSNLKRSSFIQDLSSERNEVFDKHQDTKVEAFKTLDGSKLKESGKNLNVEEKAKLKDGDDENGPNPEENSKEEKNMEELNKDVDDILKNLKNNSKSLESKNEVSLKAELDKSTEFKPTRKDLKKENSEIPVDFGDSSGQKINLESLKSKANNSEKKDTVYQESKGNSHIATKEKSESVQNLSYKNRETKENKKTHQSNSLKKSFLDNKSLENEELGSKPKVFHPEEMKENYDEKTQYQDFISSIERHKMLTFQEENIEKLHGNFEDKTFVSDLVSDSHIQSIEEALKNEDEDIQESEKISTKSPENTEKIIEESLKKGKQNATLTSSLKNLSGTENKMFNNNGSKDEHPDTLKGGNKMYSSHKEEQLDTESFKPLDNEQKKIDKDEGYESKNQKGSSSFGRESERSASTVLAKDVSASENSDRSNFIDMNTISSDLANKSKEDQYISANDNMAHLKSSHKESNFIGKPIQDQIKDRIKSKLEDQIKEKLVDKEKESKTLKKESHEESFALTSNIERIKNNLSEEMKERNIEPSEAIKDEELTFNESSRKDLDHNVEDILEQEIKNKNISVDTNVTKMDIFDSFEDEGTINKEKSSTENKGSLSSRRLDEKIDSGVKFNDFNDRKKHFDLLDEPESELILSSMNVHKIGDSNEPRNNKNQILDLLNNEDDEAFELSEMNVHKE